jgi:hypothetical protein
MTQSYEVRDALLIKADALPADAGTVNGTAIDLGAVGSHGARLENCEVKLSAPALTVTQLPNTTTATYSIQASAASNFDGAVTLASGCIVQTGAGGAGAAADSFRLKLPTDCPRYLRAVVVGADVGEAGFGDCSDADMTLELLF